MEGVTLHGAWHCPFVKRVQMALKMKGVTTYVYIEENLNEKSSFLKENGGLVPILVHNGKPITESLKIIEYIDENFPGPSIFPEGLNAKAEAITLMKFVDDQVTFPSWHALWIDEAFKDKAIEGLKTLEKKIEGKDFFGNDKIGVVDIVASFIAFGIPSLEKLTGTILLTKEFPWVLRWIENYYKDPVVMEYFPINDVLAREYFPPKDLLAECYKVGLQTKDWFPFYKAAYDESEKRRAK